MCNLFYPKEKIPTTFVGAPGFLGRGYWKIKYICGSSRVFGKGILENKIHLWELQGFWEGDIGK